MFFNFELLREKRSLNFTTDKFNMSMALEAGFFPIFTLAYAKLQLYIYISIIEADCCHLR